MTYRATSATSAPSSTTQPAEPAGPATPSDGTWDDPDGRPLVLVGLSSTVMSHEEELLQRAADALGRLPVRGLVTTGPAVDPAAIRAPANVDVRRWVRHADVLPYCSAVLTHGGHGTVIKALAAGVPLVVAPLGRDQPDNAARVVRAGAGLRVSRKASAADLRNALGRVLDEPRLPGGGPADGRDPGRRTRRGPRRRRTRARPAIEGTALSHPAPRNPSWR